MHLPPGVGVCRRSELGGSDDRDGGARADKTKVSTEFGATVLACCGLGTLVLAALALFYQIMA